jgi:hypothetical protein
LVHKEKSVTLLQVVSSSFILSLYKEILPDVHSLGSVPNFSNMINSTHVVRTTQPVAYSFPNPFPRGRFKSACCRPTLSQGFPVRILRMISKLRSFFCIRSIFYDTPKMEVAKCSETSLRGILSHIAGLSSVEGEVKKLKEVEHHRFYHAVHKVIIRVPIHNILHTFY